MINMFPCDQCKKRSLTKHKKIVHEWVKYHARNVITKELQWDILLNTKGHYMKELNTLVSNATIKQQQKEVSLNT